MSRSMFILYMFIDKNSHKGAFFIIIEMCTLLHHSIDVWFVMIGQYFTEIKLFENYIWNLRVQKI